MGELETALTQIAGTLNRLSLPYMLTGAVAVTYYGEPRATHDIDVVMLLAPTDVTCIKAALEPGFSVDVESIKAALREGNMFNAIHEETGLKVDQDFPHFLRELGETELPVVGRWYGKA